MTRTLIDPDVTEILYGTPVPVTRRIVQLGQAPYNGDIVPLLGESDNSEIWDAPDYPYDEEYERYLDKQNSILKTRERRRCYQCGESGIGKMRHVIGHTVVSQHFDPTEAYNLDCGHTAIDC